MNGFWDHAEIPHEMSLKMGRDQMVVDLVTEAANTTKVKGGHLALFSLQYRNNPRQVRFAFMALNTTFRSHIPQFNAPHFDTGDPYLMVLCVASRGYDLHSLKWKPAKDDNKPPDELSQWMDDQVILLIVKYFDAENRKIVTLGCYYAPNVEPLIAMVDDGWVAERLKPYIDNKEVSMPPPTDKADSPHVWECWEEFNEKDIQSRNVKRKIKNEQLWSGDVIIWQVAPASAEGGNGDASGGAAETGAPPVGEGEDDVAPVYPVNTVADLAAHLSNSIDVVVTLHDSRQPLCIDGIVSNGNWGQPRPQSAAQRDAKKDTSPRSEERPEDVALSLSPAQFNQPQERELKMDLRWHLHHVTGTIARAFSLTPQSEGQLWLFHAAPSSTCEEPLNAHTIRNETTLKELQRTTTYLSAPAKRPLALHAVELPPHLGRQALERGLCTFCVRFYDDQVREVGSCVIAGPSSGTVQDVLAEAKRCANPEWGFATGPLRVLEVVESRLHKLCKPDMMIRSLSCSSKSNIFYHCLRIEPDTDAGMPEGSKLMEIFHCDRQSQQAFAQPLLLALAPGEKSGNIKARCKAKLQVPDAEFKSWRLVRCARTGKTHLKDDEPWDSDLSADAKLCLEHVHPNPTNSLARQSRYNKPLTIKG